MIFNSIKFRRVPSFISILFGMLFFFHSQNILAAQKALITSERAIIYADPIMTSPIGYLSKGKKILISEKSKNRGQVFALIVAGKIAYISSSDISTELESVESSQLSAERFQRQTLDKRHSSYSLLGFIYPSKINFGKANGKLKSGDLLHWNGLSLKGSTEATSNYDLDFVFNYMSAVNSSERFKAVELGLGLSWKILKNQ